MNGNEPPLSLLQTLRRWFSGETSGEVSENFSPRAQQILSLARKAAIERGHPYVQPDHIFLSILLLNRGVAAAVLRRLGCRLTVLQTEVEAYLERRPKAPCPAPPSYSRQAKALLAAAARQAGQLSHFYVGTEHLLLGLLTGPESDSRQLLEGLDLDAEAVRIGVLRELDPNLEPGHTGDGPVASDN